MRKNTMLTRVSVACTGARHRDLLACSSGDDTQIGKARRREDR